MVHAIEQIDTEPHASQRASYICFVFEPKLHCCGCFALVIPPLCFSSVFSGLFSATLMVFASLPPSPSAAVTPYFDLVSLLRAWERPVFHLSKPMQLKELYFCSNHRACLSHRFMLRALPGLFHKCIADFWHVVWCSGMHELENRTKWLKKWCILKSYRVTTRIHQNKNLHVVQTVEYRLKQDWICFISLSVLGSEEAALARVNQVFWEGLIRIFTNVWTCNEGNDNPTTITMISDVEHNV